MAISSFACGGQSCSVCPRVPVCPLTGSFYDSCCGLGPLLEDFNRSVPELEERDLELCQVPVKAPQELSEASIDSHATA